MMDEQIERSANLDTSKQPRFGDIDEEAFFMDTLRWVELATEQEPEYSSDTRERDEWLSWFWTQEPHIAGVLHSAMSIDANRGWSLTGGRNQILRWSKIMHNWAVASGLYGWRPGMNSAALSFYASDLGAIIEVGRDGIDGPVRGFFHTDPTTCNLTGDRDYPLEYHPQVGGKGAGKNWRKTQKWRESDYMRVASMPNVREKYKGAGYCFVSRAKTFAQLMIAVIMHDKEELGAQAPQGLLLLHGIRQTQFNTAMEARKEELRGEGWRYYNRVAVLASTGVDQIDAKLVALSQLPKGFDLQQFVSLMMYGYALCIGYDPSEFYPVQFGALGRGTEMEVQHEKATAKGSLNFAHAMQEQLQRDDMLPDTLQFEFDERDEEGELKQAMVNEAWAKVFRHIRETGLQTDQEGGITREELRVLLAEKGVIPYEWTQYDEDVEGTDEGVPPEDENGENLADTEGTEIQPKADVDEEVLQMRENKMRRVIRDRLLSKPGVLRAAVRFPNQQILRYSYPDNSFKVVWSSGANLLRRRSHTVKKPKVLKREKGDVLYSDDDVEITEGDVDTAVSLGEQRIGGEWKEILDNDPIEV